MIPPDPPEFFEEELAARKGSSGLPVSLDLTDPDNMGTICKFLYLLHEGNCLGRTADPPGESSLACIDACMFKRLAVLQSVADHYKTCQGASCTDYCCKQAISLRQHWTSCNNYVCHICSAAVDLIIENFCKFLGNKNEAYATFAVQIQTAPLPLKKRVVKLNVSRDS